ncbi:ribonuclease H-like protein [Xylaria telfairii]|nr:ribonuclease H-like protein [Xylaria telfairii]
MDQRWIFSPKLVMQQGEVDETKLIAYNTELQLSHLQMPDPDPMSFGFGTDPVVICINGLCEGKGGRAKASWGVYFGPGSRYNEKGTSQADQSIAEIDALWHTVRAIERICTDNNSLRRFVIVTDSDYVVLAMSFWAPNGGKSAQGRPVPFADRFIPLWERLNFTNFMDCRDVKIKFWRVPPMKNDEAYQLAKQAL